MFEENFERIFTTNKSWETLTGLRELLRLEPDRLKDKINEAVLEIHDSIKDLRFINPTTSKHAWQLRRELTISRDKLKNNFKGYDLEDSVERLFVACGDDLYNQFAVIAGALPNQGRKSVDIIKATDGKIEEMIEFKEWKPAAGHLLFAALEILINYFLYKKVLDDDIASMHKLRKPSFAKKVDLTVLAPKSYYGEFENKAGVIARCINHALQGVIGNSVFFSFQELPEDFKRNDCIKYFRFFNGKKDINLTFINKYRTAFEKRVSLEVNYS